MRIQDLRTQFDRLALRLDWKAYMADFHKKGGLWTRRDLREVWRYTACHWTEDRTQCLRSIVSGLKGVERAILVDRQRDDPNHSHTLLVLEHGGGLINPRRILDTVEGDAPGELFVVLSRYAPSEVLDVPGALLYHRKLSSKVHP